MLILRLFSELLPLLACGVLIGRFKQGFASQIAPPLINFGVPVSLMGLLLKSGLDWALFQALAMALLAIALMIVVIRIFPTLRRYISSRTLLLGSVFGNSGYFGIPVSLTLLQSQSLVFSIGYDLGATLLVWSLGPILLGNTSSNLTRISAWKNLFKALTSSPASRGLFGAVFIQLTPWSDQITSALWIPSRIVIVSALMVVGMRVGASDPAESLFNKKLFLLIQPSLLVKLIIFPVLMFALSKAFNVSNVMCNALVLQAATPTAISVLLLAEASKEDQKVAASLVVWSTLMGLVTVPLWFLVL